MVLKWSVSHRLTLWTLGSPTAGVVLEDQWNLGGAGSSVDLLAVAAAACEKSHPMESSAMPFPLTPLNDAFCLTASVAPPAVFPHYNTSVTSPHSFPAMTDWNLGSHSTMPTPQWKTEISLNHEEHKLSFKLCLSDDISQWCEWLTNTELLEPHAVLKRFTYLWTKQKQFNPWCRHEESVIIYLIGT